MRYLRLINVFMRTSISAQAGFRVDFLIGVVTNMLWLLAYITLISTIFYNFQTVAGWTRAEALIIFGIFELLDGTVALYVWRNLENFASLIREGSMDYIITKPIDSQFHVAFRRFNPEDIGVLGAGVVAIWYGFSQISYRPDVIHISATIFLLLCASVLYYSIAMLVETMCFWFIRLDNISILVDITYVVARYPLNVFEGFARKLVFYVIPLAFFATVPTMVLLAKVSIAPWVAAGALLATVFFIISRLFWFKGLRAYSSASS